MDALLLAVRSLGSLYSSASVPAGLQDHDLRCDPVSVVRCTPPGNSLVVQWVGVRWVSVRGRLLRERRHVRVLVPVRLQGVRASGTYRVA